MRSHSLTRRIHVREQRSNVEWRTRAVDHCTESLLNDATQPCDATTNDPVMLLIQILLVFMMHGVAPVAWKRDTSKAYRRVLLQSNHFQFACAVFQALGKTWVSEQYCCVFGAVSAVHGWHRIGAGVRFLARTLFFVPCERYVDDFLAQERRAFTGVAGA